MDKQTGAFDADILVHDVREGPMSPFQVGAVATCMAINMLDGFDVMAVAFTGPVVAKVWALSPTQLGLLFSAGIAGMTLGSLLLSPLADVFGRRMLVLLGLTLITAGMILSGFSRGLDDLMLLRMLTGLGVGALLSSINTIVTEYSSTRRKNLSVAFMTIGFPLGATAGGTISVFLIAEFGWRAVYLLGGAMSALLIPIVILCLPESLDFLLSRRPANALVHVNTLLRRMNRPQITSLPAAHPSHAPEMRLSAILDSSFLGRTLIVCAAYFLTMLPFYFMLNWTPKVLVDQGLSVSAGISGAVLMNAAGIVGGLLFGVLAPKVGVRRLASYVMVSFFLSIVGFGMAERMLGLQLVLAATVGFFLNATICGLFAVIAGMYPPRVRNTGTGIVIGAGRIGAVLGPYLGGVMIAAGWSRPAYCLALACALIPAALLVRRAPLLHAGPGRAIDAASLETRAA